MRIENYIISKISSLVSAEVLPSDTSEDELIEMGLVKFTTVVDAFNDWMRHWGQNIIDVQLEKFTKYTDAYGLLMDKRGVSYQEYLQLFEGKVSEDEYPHHRAFEFFCILDSIQHKQFIAGKEPTFQTYIDDLAKTQNETLDFFLEQELDVKLPISEFYSHAHAMGMNGSGKTSFLKTNMWRMWHKSQKKRNMGILLLDPAGDVSLEALFFKLSEDRDRVIFIDPTVHKLLGTKKKHVPVINPFYLSSKTEESINILTQELAWAIAGLVGELSINMQNVLKSCIGVLLRYKDNPTLDDLYDFMIDGRNEKYIEMGLKSKITAHRDFFQNDFKDKVSYGRTRNSIKAKIYNLRLDPVFNEMTSGKNRIDLEEAMNTGKIILCRFAKGTIGPDVSEALGRLMLAQVQAIAQKRIDLPERKRIPFFVYVDEAQNYVSGSTAKTILAESRKFGLHLILSHQNPKQFKEGDGMWDYVTSNTNVKIMGVNVEDINATTAKMLGIKGEEINQMKKHYFYIRTLKSGKKAFMVKNPPTLVDTQNPDYYMPYKIDQYGNKELSYEQRAFLEWMVYDSGYYKKSSYTKEKGPVKQNNEEKTEFPPFPKEQDEIKYNQNGPTDQETPFNFPKGEF